MSSLQVGLAHPKVGLPDPPMGLLNPKTGLGVPGGGDEAILSQLGHRLHGVPSMCVYSLIADLGLGTSCAHP